MRGLQKVLHAHNEATGLFLLPGRACALFLWNKHDRPIQLIIGGERDTEQKKNRSKVSKQARPR